MPRSTNHEGTYRIAGCDLGKSAAKFVVGRASPGGQLSIEKTELVEHDGRPMEAFRDWYRREDVASCSALGATGLHAEELAAPALAGLPEDACLQAALPHVMSDGPLSLVSIGARGYAVLARSVDGRFQFLQNDKCSSGTGETMVKIASRFGHSIEEADRAALAADESIPITARCSVFAFRLRRDPPRTAGAATHALPAGLRSARDPSHRQRREARSGIS